MTAPTLIQIATATTLPPVTPPSDPLLLASRLVDACPAPALLVEAGGRLRSANRAATSLLGLTTGGAEPSLRDLVGIGWREVELIARDGQSDLAAELPTARLLADRRGTRVHFEPIAIADGSLAGVVAFFEPSSDTVAPTRRSGRNDRGFDALFGDDPAVAATKEAGARFARTLLPILLLAEVRRQPWHGRFTVQARGAIGRSSPSTAVRSRRTCSRASSSATPRAPSPEAGREGNDGKIGAARGGTYSRRGRRDARTAPGAAPARARGRHLLPGGRQPAATGRCPPGLRHLPRSAPAGRRRRLPSGTSTTGSTGPSSACRRCGRRQDVSALMHRLQGLAAEAGRATPPELAPEAFESMVRFPGRATCGRSKQALQHALILSDGDTIRPEHLPRELAESEPMPERRDRAAGCRTRPLDRAADARAHARRDRARAARSSPSPRPAATSAAPPTSCGIARSTIYRRLRRHGLLA